MQFFKLFWKLFPEKEKSDDIRDQTPFCVKSVADRSGVGRFVEMMTLQTRYGAESSALR